MNYDRSTAQLTEEDIWLKQEAAERRREEQLIMKADQKAAGTSPLATATALHSEAGVRLLCRV